ncbi:hypothetical protein [Rhizobium sp. YTU87027]|uniref:hypothetical protein n=1 Tax=Rhizobium sp. YTU87027 TaxID=3417741 RepID=UPI003D69A2FC
MMTSLNLTRSTRGNPPIEDTSDHAGYPQSMLLRMMLKASRQMARSKYPRLDPEALSETMKRDLGFVDWGRTCHEG